MGVGGKHGRCGVRQANLAARVADFYTSAYSASRGGKQTAPGERGAPCLARRSPSALWTPHQEFHR